MLLASGGHTWTNQFYDESSRTGPQDPSTSGASSSGDRTGVATAPKTTTYNFKVAGRYDTPWWDLGASTTYRFHSG